MNLHDFRNNLSGLELLLGFVAQEYQNRVEAFQTEFTHLQQQCEALIAQEEWTRTQAEQQRSSLLHQLHQARAERNVANARLEKAEVRARRAERVASQHEERYEIVDGERWMLEKRVAHLEDLLCGREAEQDEQEVFETEDTCACPACGAPELVSAGRTWDCPYCQKRFTIDLEGF